MKVHHPASDQANQHLEDIEHCLRWYNHGHLVIEAETSSHIYLRFWQPVDVDGEAFISHLVLEDLTATGGRVNGVSIREGFLTAQVVIKRK